MSASIRDEVIMSLDPLNRINEGRAIGKVAFGIEVCQ